jgi:hypothetical protein
VEVPAEESEEEEFRRFVADVHQRGWEAILKTLEGPSRDGHAHHMQNSDSVVILNTVVLIVSTDLKEM